MWEYNSFITMGSMNLETDIPQEILASPEAYGFTFELFHPTVWNVTPFHLGTETFYLGRESDPLPEGPDPVCDPTRMVLLNAQRQIINRDFRIPETMVSPDFEQVEDPRAYDIDLPQAELALFGLQEPVSAIGLTTVSNNGNGIEWNNAIMLVGKGENGQVTVQKFINLPENTHCKNTVIHSVKIVDREIEGRVRKVLAIQIESRNGMPHTFFQSEVLVVQKERPEDKEKIIYNEISQTEHPTTPWNETNSGLNNGPVVFNEETGNGLEYVHGQIEDKKSPNRADNGDALRVYAAAMAKIRIKQEERHILRKYVALPMEPDLVTSNFPDIENGKRIADHRKGVLSMYSCDHGELFRDKDGRWMFRAIFSRADEISYIGTRALRPDEIEWVGEKALLKAEEKYLRKPALAA